MIWPSIYLDCSPKRNITCISVTPIVFFVTPKASVSQSTMNIFVTLIRRCLLTDYLIKYIKSKLRICYTNGHECRPHVQMLQSKLANIMYT